MSSQRAMTSSLSRSGAPAFSASVRPGGRWINALRNSDVNQLWAEMHRLVCFHPLVRASYGAGLLVEEGARHAQTDLTQELFVQLLGKNRFQHYLDTQMTDAEIECEISQLELSNLLTFELRKRHPESYRLARRIAVLIQTSAIFRRFDSTGESDRPPYRRLTNKVYGLHEWPDDKAGRDVHDAGQRVQMVTVRGRDTRRVGRTGEAQVVISNDELKKLIVCVLEAVDAPLDVRTLRSLVMSRLPVLDTYMVALGSANDDEQTSLYELADSRATPEQALLQREVERDANRHADEFLASLQAAARGKMKQYKRMLDVLWHCYLSPQHRTQLAVAAALGVSDSLISNYRKSIESALRALSFFRIEEARCFEIALRERVRALVTVGDECHTAAHSEEVKKLCVS